MLKEKYLSVDTGKESLEKFLAKPDSELSDYQRKVRMSYLPLRNVH